MQRPSPPGDDCFRDAWRSKRRVEPGVNEAMKTIEEANKALVLEAFDTLFNKRDYKAAERFWSANYIQHSAHIPAGREGLFNMIKNAPPTLRYEHDVILADKEFVIVHGRFSGHGGPRSWIAADIVSIANGLLTEHWDVLQRRSNQGRVAKRVADVRH